MVLIFIPQYLFHVTIHIGLTFGSLYHNPRIFVKGFSTGIPKTAKNREKRAATWEKKPSRRSVIVEKRDQFFIDVGSSRPKW